MSPHASKHRMKLKKKKQRYRKECHARGPRSEGECEWLKKKKKKDASEARRDDAENLVHGCRQARGLKKEESPKKTDAY